MTRGKTLILGMAVGALSLALYAQLKRVTAEDDPEELMNRLESQLAELDKRLKAMQQNAA